jgi:transketolase
MNPAHTSTPTPANPRLLAQAIREAVIQQSYRAHVGHIGSSLSIADLLAALYGGVLGRTDHDDPGRDRVVLSKGHAALALYAALELSGRLPAGTLDSYCRDETMLGVHPEHAVDGVDFCTGALGHGLSIGAGAALAARVQRRASRAFVVMSDAELNEGSVWEAAMFAAHHGLANLVCVVDVNGQQALGYTRDVLDLADLPERWAAFGWDVHVVDGHDPEALVSTINGLRTSDGAPHVLLASTVFGKGVRFMENRIEWHYLPLSDTDYVHALGDLGVEVSVKAAGV